MKQAIIAAHFTLCLLQASVSEGGAARDILEKAGVEGGLVVHLGCGDGTLTADLRANGSYLVHGLDTDARNVREARQHLQQLGVYGEVSVDRLQGTRLPYADNLVNLIVAENPGPVPMEEVLRVLCPDGVAYIGGKKTVKARPSGIDDWTHYLYDAGNNAVSRDAVAGPPRRFQWISGPKWCRSHDHLSSVSAMVSAGGRIFYIIDEGPIASVALRPRWFLVARDAFSGVFLWKRPVDPWEGHLRGFRSGPTELARRLVAAGERVYVTLGYGKPVTALDAATGETIRTYRETDNALEFVVRDEVLFVVAGDRPPDNTAGAAMPDEPTERWMHWRIWRETPPEKRLVAIQAASGSVLWSKSDRDTSDLMPTTLCTAGGKVFFQNPREIFALESFSGEPLWRAARPVSRHRPSWSAPTLVVYKDVVLCGDRAADAVHSGAGKAGERGSWVVDSHGGLAPPGRITAFSAETGRKLWESPCKEVYNAPVDVLVADGLVWSGKLVGSREPGITRGLDFRTGKVRRERPKDQQFFKIVMGHHRCYRNRATANYLVLGRDGIEYIDIASGEGFGHAWVRGACQYGVMPCNGLTYVPPHSCACHVESKLNSFNALAAGAAPEEEARPAADTRLEKGPAFGKASTAEGREQSGAWPTYRHDNARSGSTTASVPSGLRPAWRTKLGGKLSTLVVAGGRVLVADIDAHEVHALDADTGKPCWSHTVGGRVDSPPTLHGGTAIFGAADGWITCLRARDGELAWRFRAAPRDRRIVAYGRLESVWPVPGSVLVDGDVVFAVSGRTAHLDGGMRLLRLDANTGKMLSETALTTAALPDVLSSDGESVFLRHRRFDKQGARQPSNVPHLYSPAGFLDGSWWHRTYWLFGSKMQSNYGGWPVAGSRVPAGRIMVMDEEAIYGFGRFNQYTRVGAHVGLGRMQYLLYAHSWTAVNGAKPEAQTGPGSRPGRGARRGGAPAKPNKVSSLWSKKIPLLARAMVLSAGRTLFVAGPPDLFGVASGDKPHPYDPVSPESLRAQQEALDGKRGALLHVVSARDGEELASYQLEAPPVWDGMAATDGKLYIAMTDGSLACWQATGAP